MSSVQRILPVSTDVRDFLHRDVYPETERKIRRLFRKKFKTQEEFDDVESDVISYLLDHIWETEKEDIIAGTPKGKRLKEKYIDCKMIRLRQILFSEGGCETGDESVDETEMVPITQYMEMKKDYEDKLLDALDENIKLRRIITQRCSLKRNPAEKSESRSEEGEKDIDYVYANSVLSDLALLREVRKKHGEAINEERVEERNEEIIVTPPEVDALRPEPEEPIEDEIDELSLRINETKISSPPSSSPIPIEDEIDALSSTINETKVSSPPCSSPTPVVSEEEVPNEMDSIKLECPICYCELNTDVDSDDYTGCCVGQYCGHALCESCWNEYRRLRNKVCPVCRKLLYIGRGRPPKANVF